MVYQMPGQAAVGLRATLIEQMLGEIADPLTTEIDFSIVDTELFLHFLTQFPCFRDHEYVHSVEMLYDEYVCDQLSDEQDVVFEFLMDLVTPFDFDFVLKDCFHLLAPNDRLALASVLAQYSDWMSAKTNTKSMMN